MITTYKHKKITWVNITDPQRDEVVHLMEEYNLPELASEELLQKTVRGKVDFYEKQKIVYLVLHFPIISKTGKKNESEQEIDFIISKNVIITSHFEEIEALQEFSKLFEVNSVLDKTEIGEHAGFVFFHIARELYKDSMLQLRNIDDDLQEIEISIFEGLEEQMVKKISDSNRKLLDFKQAINEHEDILKSFEHAGLILFGEGFTYYLSDIMGEYRKVRSTLESRKDILRDLKETNDSLLANKTNAIMKALTVMSFIMLPLTLITGVFGMNTNIHLAGNDFYIIIAAMTMTGIAMFVYFKGRGWF